MQIRVILDRSEREHQREMNAEIAKRDEIVGKYFVIVNKMIKISQLIKKQNLIKTESMRADNECERLEMEERFRERLLHITEEFATELTNNKEELQARHKKKIGIIKKKITL